MKSFFVTLLIAVFFPFSNLFAQKNVTYQSLLQRAAQPNIYTDEIAFPKENGELEFSIIFRMEYDFIPFIKVRPDMELPESNPGFFSNIRMGLELFKGNHADKSEKEIKKLEPFLRSSWQDTAYAKTFEDTRSRNLYAQGTISANLEPGPYTYKLILTRGESKAKLTSRLVNINLPEYEGSEKGFMMVTGDFIDKENEYEASILNYGDNVLYGKDFNLMILHPDTSDTDHYKIELFRLLPGDEQKPADDVFYSTEITSTDKFYGTNFKLNSSISGISLTIDKTENGFPLSVITIPNRNFPNSGFKIDLKSTENDSTIASTTIGSLWPEIPISLLNLDVALDMLRFIVDEERLKELKSGSVKEKENKFTAFWEKRDPTPDSEFNELMVEYYDRIDYAYQEFSSPQNPGFNTDQGNAYILFGPPNNIERKFPGNAPTREIWYYDNRTLVFEATSGFGDFKLIAQN